MMRLLRFLLIVLATSLVWVWIFDKMIEEGYVTLNEVPTEQVQVEPAPASASTPTPAPKKQTQQTKQPTKQQTTSEAPAKRESIAKSTTKVEQPIRPTSAPAPKTKQSAQTVAETTASTQPTEPVAVALAEGIIGEWIPVEIADENVVFSKYGTCKQGKYGTDYVYKISGDKVLLYYDVNIPVVAESMTAKVTSQSGIYYIEIYNNGKFGGKYRSK